MAFASATHVPSVDLKNRATWIQVKVFLNNPEGEVVAEGLATVVDPRDAVANQELGWDDIGVAILEVVDTEENSLTIGSIVRWKLRHLVFENVKDSQSNTTTTDDRTSLHGKRKYTFLKRSQRDLSNKPKRQKMAMEVRMVSTVACCKRRCCQHADWDAIEEERARYKTLSWKAARNFVYEALRSSIDASEHQVGGMVFHRGLVCMKAWRIIYGVPRTTFYRIKTEFEEQRVQQAVHGNDGTHKTRGHVVYGEAIFKRFVETCSEQQPHKTRLLEDGTRDTQRVLPSMYTKGAILEDVNRELQSNGYRKLSQFRFSRLWSNRFRDVSIGKYSSFSKCDECTAIKMALLKNSCIAQERETLVRRRLDHNIEQRSCRTAYYHNRILSMERLDSYLCIIHDKMDQKKTCLPRLNLAPKAISSSMQLPVSLFGIIAHGHGAQNYGNFFVPLWGGRGANMMIASLAKHLRSLQSVQTELNGQPLHKALVDRTPYRVQLEEEQRLAVSRGAPCHPSEYVGRQIVGLSREASCHSDEAGRSVNAQPHPNEAESQGSSCGRCDPIFYSKQTMLAVRTKTCTSSRTWRCLLPKAYLKRLHLAFSWLGTLMKTSMPCSVTWQSPSGDPMSSPSHNSTMKRR